MAFEVMTARGAAKQDRLRKPVLNETDFLAGLERLRRGRAGEIADRWEQQYDELVMKGAKGKAIEAFFDKFAAFEKKREEALFSMEIPNGLDKGIIDEIKEFDFNVVLSYGNPSLFQGNGATAEVYEVLGHPGICVKFITNQANYNENNHIRVEFNFLNLVRDLQSGSVRSPKPYFLRIHPRDGHSYGMERINGASLSQILEKPENYDDLISIAKGLDRQKIGSELREFISQVHDLGITHNDVRWRNIMLDRNGNLFLIDYGKAARAEKENLHAMRRDSDMTSLDSELHSFFEEIDKIKK